MEIVCNECNAKYEIEIIDCEEENTIKYYCLFCGEKILEIKDKKNFVPKDIINVPPTKIALPGLIYTQLDNYLSPYKKLFDSFDIEKKQYDNNVYIVGEKVPNDGWNLIEMHGVKKDPVGITSGIGLKLYFLHDGKEAHIPNIIIPQFLKHNGIGKKMISLIYETLKQFDYRLFVVQMVDSFYNRLLQRGAVPIDGDTVEITDNTKLD
ncbi:hypothetical protein FACS189476_00740 [Spirochaetia bacterium]|nr:hypothetical protein FACS189476_00740 [Spirochaetia bacterium]